MVARFVHLAVVLVLFGFFQIARAEGENYKRSQYYRGVTHRNVVTEVVEADIDGDASSEVIICYREPGDAVNQPGGVLILSDAMSGYRVAWHAVFEGLYPKSVSVDGNSLTFDLIQTTMTEDKRVSKTLTRGKDFFFRDDEKSPFYEAKVRATSTLGKDSVEPGNIFDRDLKTAWAEGGESTGVDESITIEFSKAVNLGLIGVLHGNYLGRRQWLDNNRLHRAEVTVETRADRYDVESDIDFEADLGLGLYGDRVELSFSNKPVMRYFKLNKKNVLSLEIKITSVLLGEKNDDTYITEVDLAELIPSDIIFGRAKKPDQKEKDKEPPAAEEEEEEEDWDEDF